MSMRDAGEWVCGFLLRQPLIYPREHPNVGTLDLSGAFPQRDTVSFQVRHISTVNDDLFNQLQSDQTK